ncbi:MAG: tRNA (guanine-N1)-methyltransferase [Bacteroidota bacterium]
MKIFSKLFIIALLLSVSTTFGQTKTQDEKGSLNSGSIESQFDYLYKKSGSYQEYKVVKKTNYYKIKANVLDSLKSLSKRLNESHTIIEGQKSEISSLKEELKTTNLNLTNVTNEKDSMKLLGISMSKSGYNSLMWLIIVGLTLFLLFFIYQFKNSNSVTKVSQKSLSELEEEFDEYKRRSIEREQKVRRELQDEINKRKYGNTSGKEK